MAVVTDMGVYGNVGEILQPMLKNRFRVEFRGIGESQNATALTIQVITADRPKLSFEEITIDRYNSRAYIPGKHTFETTTIVFESDIGGGVINSLKDQLEQQQKIIGMSPRRLLPPSATGAALKFATVISMLDGDDHAYEIWYLEGCWIQNIDYGDLDYAASETIKISVTLRYDHARQDTSGVRSGKATGGQAGIGGLAADLVNI